MTITPGLGIAIMMNNYLHDVATALLIASAFALWSLYRLAAEEGDEGAIRLFLAAYDRFLLLVKVALAWIVIGGVPRTVFYVDFEWANAAGKNQVPALIVKHVLITLCVAGGIWGWLRLRAHARALREMLND